MRGGARRPAAAARFERHPEQCAIKTVCGTSRASIRTLHCGLSVAVGITVLPEWRLARHWCRCWRQCPFSCPGKPTPPRLHWANAEMRPLSRTFSQNGYVSDFHTVKISLNCPKKPCYKQMLKLRSHPKFEFTNLRNVLRLLANFLWNLYEEVRMN